MALRGCYGFLKWLVFLINLIFWLAGVGILVLSIWLLFDQALLFAAKGALNYQTGTYILLITGALMTIIGFLGCCGALRESQCLLGTFFVFLMVILVAEISGGVWAYMNRAELHKMVRETVRNTVQKEYTKDNVTTTTFDMIQQSLQCCGSHDYKSWFGSAFHPGGLGRLDIGVSSQNQNISHVVPESCCVEPGTPECKKARQDVKPEHNPKIIYTEGCTSKLEDLLKDYFNYVLAFGVGICIVEVLGMIFSMLLCCAIRKIEDFKA